METKKQMYEATKLILQVWKQQQWLNYDEIEPNGKQKKAGVFKVIQYKMPNKVSYVFELTQDQYNYWRTIKPSFKLGK